MSRKRLDHEVNELIKKVMPPDIEKTRVCDQETSKQGLFAQKISEYVKHLPDNQQREIFSPIYEFFYETCEKEYMAGDTQALMKCIDFCCTNKLVIPSWAAEAFHLGYTKIRNYEARSWDAVLGKPHKKGTHLKEQRCEEDKVSIYKYVKERIDQGHPIDQELFDLSAIRFGSYAKEIKDIYYDMEHKRVNHLLNFYKGAEMTDKVLKELYPHIFQKKSR